ncbi:MAG: YfcE family phosphodiesterase [Planctomycetota bacterium]
MLIGIISDTHDEFDRTTAAVDQLIELGVSELFHCGDLFSEPIVETCARLPFSFVFGNHDADMMGVLERAAVKFGATCLEWGQLIELHGKRIAITHGHLTMDLKPLSERQPDYLLTGHFHEPSDWMENGVRRINPGALHRAERFTFATLDLEKDKVRFIEID